MGYDAGICFQSGLWSSAFAVRLGAHVFGEQIMIRRLLFYVTVAMSCASALAQTAAQ